MLANEATELALGLARRFEGLSLVPYLDPVGIPTIGYGFTRYPHGRLVRLTDPALSVLAADGILRSLMEAVVVSVVRIAPTADTPGRLAALSDFAYNLGLPRLRNSTLLRKVRARDWTACPPEFRKWRLAGGKILPGLVLRREAEIQLLGI